ncbi:MAG: UDP-N-acetylglucosamine transferase subunit alg14, partial [Piptocephalis tieghemiana]
STHSHGKPIRLLILLGSGGHTAEMLRLLQHLASSSHRDLYAPSQYLITAGDRMSEGRVRRFDSQPSTLPSRLYPIPRARKVKQSWLTTPFTTAWSFVASIRILWCLSFDVFLCNGPGTCVPLALLIFIPKFFGFSTPPIIYVESFARVKSLSLSGKLLYPIVDLFLVQWPDLVQRWPKAQYHGVL